MIVIATGVVLGCSAAPSDTASPSIPAASTATPSSPSSPMTEPTSFPTPSPTALVAGLGEHWTPIALPGERATVADGTYGESGFVLAGWVCGTSKKCVPSATAWFRADDGTWRPADVADAKNAEMTDVAYNGTYVAAGTRSERLGGGVIRTTGVFWRSDDGRSWTSIGSIDLGECDEENGCPRLGRFEVTQSGFMLASWTGGVTDAQNGTYRSADGRHWTQVDPKAVGRTPAVAEISASITLDDSIVAAWPRPDDDSSDMWSTTTGRTWAGLGSVAATSPSLTTDGEQIVAAGLTCAGDACETLVWTSRDGEPFLRAGDALQSMIDVRVAFAAEGGFVLVGAAQDALVVYGSTDAATWAQRTPDLEADFADCEITTLVSGPSSLILISEPCNEAWLSAA